MTLDIRRVHGSDRVLVVDVREKPSGFIHDRYIASSFNHAMEIAEKNDYIELSKRARLNEKIQSNR